MRREALLAGAAALLGAVLYLDSIPNGFVFDDRPVVERNQQIRSLRNLPEIFRTPYHRYFGSDARERGLYRPLTIATFAFDRALLGPRSLGFHATNVVLHAVASGLVVLAGLALGLAPAVALGGGLLFAAHPVHTEAVANLVGRAELLATIFFLVGLVSYLNGRRERSTRGRFFALASVSLFLALLSKENAITFFGVAIAWECLQSRTGSGIRERLEGLSWLLFPIVGYLALRSWALSSAVSSSPATEYLDNPLLTQGVGTRALTASAVASRYVGLLVCPWRLSPDYSYAQILPVGTPWDPLFLAGAFLAVVTCVFVFLAASRAPRLAFLALFGVVTFSVVSNLPFAIGTIMAERLLYLPSVAFCLLAASLWPLFRGRLGSKVATGCAVIVVGVFSARTVARNLDWRNDFILFSKAALSSPRSAKVLNNLGAELLKRGENVRALELLEGACAIAPDWAQARINLAQALLVTHSPARAEEEARHALRLLPEDPLAHVKLAEVLESTGKSEEAARELGEALRLDPSDTDARLRLGFLATARGDLPAAERELTTVVQLAPDSIQARTALGLLYSQMRRPDRAVLELREAMRLDPGNTRARNNLGNALRDAGSLDESIRELEQAVALDERFAPSHYNLGLSFEKAGRIEEARQQYRRALEIDPAHGGSQRAIARLSPRAGESAQENPRKLDP